VTRLYAYIDETGDLGQPGGTSPIFGMAGVVVDESGARQLRDAVQELRSQLQVRDGQVLSWKGHLKDHERRKLAARRLARVESLRVVYVYAKKEDFQYGGLVNERGLLYNYIAGKMYKSILWTANYWDSHPAELRIRYGHVKGFDHDAVTRPYFAGHIATDPKVPVGIQKSLHWVSADKYLESQAADMYAGFLKAAVWPDRYNNYEGQYLQTVWHQIRNSEKCAIPLGLMSMPKSSLVTDWEWFPCNSCRHKKTG
jgi:hypothetical protein